LEEKNHIKHDLSIWHNKRKSSNTLTHIKLDDFSDKTKILMPKKHKLQTHQMEKLNNFTTNVSKKNTSYSTTNLNAEKKVLAKDRKQESYLQLQKNYFSNSSFSTDTNSLCHTPISSPEPDVRKTPNGMFENLSVLNNSYFSKNLNESYYEDLSINGSYCTNNNMNLKICHINPFSADSKHHSPESYSMNNNNFVGSAGNIQVSNLKVNSVNNNSRTNLNSDSNSSISKKPVYPLNPNVYCDTTNIVNNRLINNNNYFKYSIYNNPRYVCQVPVYQNQIYFNNFNIPTSSPSYIPRKTKYSNDPLDVLREQTYSMVRTSNGKPGPFEEPHNRINLENVIKLLI